MSTELFITPTFAKVPHVINGIDTKTGCFAKGHVPANKGKKWSDYMGKRAQKRAAKGWANLDKYRPTSRPDTAGRCRKKVVALFDNGHFKVFGFVGQAAKEFDGSRENVGRCCRLNSNPQVNKKTGKLNTDHRYLGIRWYFESDDVWTHKIAL